jgi:hypothetical protein
MWPFIVVQQSPGYGHREVSQRKLNEICWFASHITVNGPG